MFVESALFCFFVLATVNNLSTQMHGWLRAITATMNECPKNALFSNKKNSCKNRPNSNPNHRDGENEQAVWRRKRIVECTTFVIHLEFSTSLQNFHFFLPNFQYLDILIFFFKHGFRAMPNRRVLLHAKSILFL